MQQYFPILNRLKQYNIQLLKSDLISSSIVIALLIPQAMAYALVAGLPPIMGLYASILPLMLYAIWGGSTTLAIGPVAILSMMTFAFLNPIYPVGSYEYLQAACLLALLTGIISLGLGLLRFGFLIQLISRPVMHSFIIAAALLIALGQLRFVFDIPIKSDNLFSFINSLMTNIHHINLQTTFIAVITILSLQYLPRLLKYIHLAHYSKIIPLFLVILAIIIHQYLATTQVQLNIPSVGIIPTGLPALKLPMWSWSLVQQLLMPAFLIAMINFVESISIAEATALQQRTRLNSNQELIAMGIANIGSGLSLGFPVGGSLSRTMVNADSGVKTPIAGIFVASFIILISLFFTHFFYYLPISLLAGTIIFSIWKLVKIKPFIETWHYSKHDGMTMIVTFLTVILVDVTTGLIVGVISTLALLLWRMSRPHIAVIGLIPNTQHFRNIKRYQTLTFSHICSIRIDENLSFLNAHSLKQFMINQVSQNPKLQHIILNCSSISNIDFSALEMLEELNEELSHLHIQLHLSEIKGPVYDHLEQSSFFQHLSGQVFLSHYQAINTLQQEDKSSQDFMI